MKSVFIIAIVAVAMIGVMVPNSDAFITNQIPELSLGTINIAGHHIIPSSGDNPSTFDSDGNLWVAETDNNRIVKYPVDNLGMYGYYTVVLGQYNLGTNFENNGGISSSSLNAPNGLTFDSSGNLWVADSGNSRVLKYPADNLATGGAATVALGQTDLTTKDHGTISSPYSHSAKTFHNPTDIAIDSTGNIWISEWNNHRVLKLYTSNLKIGGAASVVLGQTDFTSKTLGNTATTLRETAGIEFDSSGNLWVTDTGGHRVLKYPVANLATGGAATVALGQVDLTSMATGNTATTVDTPEYITFDSDGNLWLSDRDNHRVLKYPAANLATGGAATVALGQADLTSKATGNTATTLDAPRGLDFDSSGNLWVVDGNNHRVLKYPAANLATGGAATVALGQADLTSKASGTTATKFLDLRSLEFDSDGNLWVADKNNRRILMFPEANLVTGGAATLVLGQPDFTSNTQNTAANGGLASTSLDTVTGLAFDSSGDLWVVDDGNHRVMKYQNITGSQSTSSISTGDNSITLDTFTTSFTSSNSITGNKVDVQSSTTNPTGNSTISGTPISNYFTVETNTPGLLSSRTVQLTYTDSEVGDLDESTLQINRFSDNVWTVLDTTVNLITNTLTATTPGFSTFSISGFSPSSSSGNGGGNNCDSNGFGNNNSLRVYQVMYDVETNEVQVHAYSTCGSLQTKITTPTGQSILGLSTEQPYLDDRILIYSGVIDESDEKFNISIQNKRHSFTETFYINDKSITKKYTGTTGYTSEQQGSTLPTVTSKQTTVVSEPSVTPIVQTIKDPIIIDSKKQIPDEKSNILKVQSIEYTPEPVAEETKPQCGVGTKLVDGICKIIKTDEPKFCFLFWCW
ncbi:MAG: NHL repeat-containing protein [Marine Group I thaumarchaeote]|nr:MAG: NHL repeat-containing protein [Marine Group I thaumarchaeote]